MAKKKPVIVPTVAVDTKYASLALACGIISLVPLLNIVAIPLGIIFGVMGVIRARKQPGEPGMARAIIGLAMCIVWLLMTAYTIYVYGPAVLLER